VTGLVAIAVGAVALLAVAAPVYGLPPVHHLVHVALGFVLGSVAFVAIGVLLGTVLPSARSAQAAGMVLFFPSFLLGAGGPPPHVMGAQLRTVAGYLPLTWVTDAVRDPWLGTGMASGSLLAVAGLAVAATLLAARRSSLGAVSR
jgi:ABC-2 type transport system permease protein